MAKKHKLSKHEERVLLFLFERKDKNKEMSLDAIIAGTGLGEDEARIALRTLREIGYLDGGARDLLLESMTGLKEMDPEFNPTKRGFSEHVILLASAISQANETFLAKELSYDREFVGLVGSRLRTAGIWKDDSVVSLHLELWRESSIGFFLDAAVAVGDLMVVGGFENDPQYQMTPSGKLHIEAKFRIQH